MKKLNGLYQFGIVLGLLTLTACNQNPYPEAAKMTVDRPVVRVASKSFSIETQDTLECTESEPCGTIIKGYVPEPGQAEVEIKGLPSGAVFDPSNGQLSYTPGFDVVDVAQHPERTFVAIALRVIVRSSLDKMTQSSRPMTLIVKHKKRPTAIQMSGSAMVKEGATLQQTITMSNPDLPNGPFFLNLGNAPDGTRVETVNGTVGQFLVKYTPKFSTVNHNDTWTGVEYQKTFNVSFYGSNSAGDISKVDQVWTVSDARQNPLLMGPDAVTVTNGTHFTLQAMDPNHEMAPQLQMESAVSFGQLKLNTLSQTSGENGNSYPTTVVNVQADQLRSIGIAPTPVTFVACNYGANKSLNNCVRKRIMVTVQAPTVVAQPSPTSTPRRGFPRLADQPEATGSAQNEEPIVAQSPFVMLGGAVFTQEMILTAKLFQGVDLLSVKPQMAGTLFNQREAVVITSEAMNSNQFAPETSDLIFAQAKSVLITTPLLSKLSRKIQTQLTALGIKFKGRFNLVSPRTNLSDFGLTPDSRSTLVSTETAVELRGTLTPESKSPMILDLGSLSSQCVPLLNLDNNAVSLPVGVKCSLENGQIMTVLGFELSDMGFDANDLNTRTQWIQTFTKKNN